MAVRDAASQTKKTPTAKEKAAATKAAVAGGYVDKNFDFIPDKDQLSREELAAQYQQAVGIIYSVPELQAIFTQALDEGWAPAKLQASVQNSKWYRENDQYARTAWAQEQTGGADWQAAQDDARVTVQAIARGMGADLTPEELTALTRRYIYEGWGQRAGGKQMIAQALAQEITFLPDSRGEMGLMGAAGQLSDKLKSTAAANGMYFADNWYKSAAQSVAMGLSTEADWERDIREQAAGMWPVYGEKIRQGMNVYDLASPYIQTMAQEFELDPNNITLNDPYIRQALTGIDETGNPKMTNLWDFQKKLREDPRWLNTSKAQNEITSVTGRVMQMFGLMGG